MGFMEEVKGIFTEKTVVGLTYAAGSGIVSGVLGALMQRAGSGNKYLGYVGNIFGAGLMAWFADKLGHPEWKGYAVFGSLFPPVWEFVTDKISPDELANKVAMGLGMSWQQAATQYYAPAQPVQLTVTPAPAPAPAPAPTAEEYMF